MYPRWEGGRSRRNQQHVASVWSYAFNEKIRVHFGLIRVEDFWGKNDDTEGT